MSPQDLIQAFSRTNRLFDKNKTFGQIVTFQAPVEFKQAIDDAIKLYSRGGDGNPLAEDWETVYKDLVIAIKAIHEIAPQSRRRSSGRQGELCRQRHCRHHPPAMKFEFHDDLIDDFHKTLMPEIMAMIES